jgi:hypothetical protein
VTGTRLATAWVRTYTRGLPADVAERRRAELASDLYEHAATDGRSAAVLGRVLWGIPADLSWRRAARVPRLRRLETGAPMTLRNVTIGLFALFLLFELWAMVGLAIFNDDTGARPFGLAMLGGAVLIGFGLYWRDDAPRRSTVLLGLGAVVPAVTLYWMVPIFGPLAVLLIGLAIASERPAPAV